MKSIQDLAREAGIPFNKYGLIGCDSCETDIDDDLQRFHDLAIAQYRESLLAGVGEAVAWMYEGEPEFDGNKWHCTHRLTQSKEFAEFQSGTIKKPTHLYTADQMAAAVAIERERIAEFVEEQDVQHLKHIAAAIGGGE